MFKQMSGERGVLPLQSSSLWGSRAFLKTSASPELKGRDALGPPGDPDQKIPPANLTAFAQIRFLLSQRHVRQGFPHCPAAKPQSYFTAFSK